MINVGNPEGLELAEVLKWGHPWHGLVTGSKLDTGIVDPANPPNTIKRTYAQPSGGNVWAFRVPGLPVPTTEPDETTQGMLWLNYAILSGRIDAAYGAQLYGRQLPPASWLLLAQDSSRWLVTLTLPVNFSFAADLDLPVRWTRFGEFGIEVAPVDVTTSCNVQQQTPAIPLTWNINGVQGSCADIASGVLTVHDLSSDGRRAILAIYGGNVGPGSADFVCNGGIGATDPNVVNWLRRPLGFLLLEISEPNGFAATLTVLASRATTLGTLVCTSNGGYSYTCVRGYCTGESWYPSTGGGSASAALTARIVGYWFNAVDSPAPVVYSANVSSTDSGSSSCNVSNCGFYTFSEQSSGQVSGGATLSFGADSVSVTAGVSSNNTESLTEIGDPGLNCHTQAASTRAYTSSAIDGYTTISSVDHVDRCEYIVIYPVFGGGDGGCRDLPPFKPYGDIYTSGDPTVRYNYPQFYIGYHNVIPLGMRTSTLLTLYVPPTWNHNTDSEMDAALIGYVGRYGASSVVTRFPRSTQPRYSSQHPDGSTEHGNVSPVCWV